MCVCVSHSVVSNSSTLCDPLDGSLPVHGIFQARTLEWVVIPFSRGSSSLRDQIQVSCNLHCRQILYHRAGREAPMMGITLISFVY